ncbi:MAG: ABC transporter substrate-binding protein [Candidatus Obscuribacterales bacterium]|nr:ABC transporter substrate-binding protein [Candidatus Obscuribacterales bacterium]
MKTTAKLSMFVSAMVACSVLVGCGSAQKSEPQSSTQQASTATKAVPEFTLAYSIYAGWMPYYLMVENGTLARCAAEEGIKINPAPMDYPTSLDAYSAGKAQALTVASMDSLMAHAANGKDTTVVVMGDTSNGNDAILARGGRTLKDLEGSNVMLMRNTVSEYVVRRCCEINKLNPSKIGFTQATDAEIQGTFQASKNQKFVCTWNPMVHEILKEKGVQRVFDSSKLPGEIQDLLVIDTATVKAHPEFARALVKAWYQTMQLMTKGNKDSDNALKFMATASGPSVTVNDLTEQLETTAMFYTPEEAVKYTESQQLKDNVARVHTFCANNGLLPPGAKAIGVSFPDGTTEGDAKNVKLHYESRYMKEAVQGSN